VGLQHHICAGRVNNDDVHQGLKITGDKNIHSFLSVVREKVGNLPLNICSTLQSNSCDNISKCIMGYCTLTLAKALK
jgi:hypothetical protein